MKLELNEKQMNNLLEFLGRVQLTGREVPAFNEIMQCFNKQIKEETEKNKK